MALGSTSPKKSDNIDALLRKSPKQTPQPLPKSSLKNTKTAKKPAVIKAAKLTDDEAEKIDLVKKKLGTDNTSEALRWCIMAT